MRADPIRLLAVVTLVASSSGCSNPSAANEENIRAALEPVIRDTFCRTLSAQRMSLTAEGDTPSFPVIVPASPLPDARPRDLEGRALLDAAVEEGLLTREETTAPARRVDYTMDLSPIALVTYRPTERGEAYFRVVESRTPSGMRPFPAACVAKAEVADIIRWTDPADMFGQTVTRVTYTYRGVDPADAMPAHMRAEVTEPKERTTTLVRTSDGWQPMPR